jgi:hypothetical protein
MDGIKGVFLLSLALVGCSSSAGEIHPSKKAVVDASSPVEASAFDASSRLPPLGGDGGDSPACVNLECDVPACPTSVSGTVFDPAGVVPLYDIAVYIPNAPLGPISSGVDVTQCEACAAPLLGNPITVALTDSHGNFTLDNVPVTTSPVQLVIQAGKFRRENLFLPAIKACQNNPIVDPTHNVRLPKNQSEGNLPLIAVTTGSCDTLEDLLGPPTATSPGFGIDTSEFQPGPPTGTGRVHVYQSNDGDTSSPAYVMWNSTALFNYDIVVSDCECGPSSRGTNGYANMKTYLDHGGRFFGSHWQYEWFGDTNAPPEWQAAVNWYPPWTSTYWWWAPSYTNFIDTTFPKGAALDEWTQFVNTSGYILGGTTPPSGTDPVYPAAAVLAGEVHSGVTRWIYADATNTTVPYTAAAYDAHYLSIDMPYSAEPSSTPQCGRAFFGDTHIAGEPSQVSALEFVFFDLSSCVQDESQPPVSPPIK